MRKMLTAVAIVIAAAASVPASAQTLFDKVIQRATARKTVPATTTPDASAQQPAGGAEMAAPAFPLDVAGVRLGMSASEARAALVKAGYSMPATNGVSYGPNFAARVRAEASQRRTGVPSSPMMTDRVMTQLKGIGPNLESITVGLTAVPSGGAAVTDVST